MSEDASLKKTNGIVPTMANVKLTKTTLRAPNLSVNLPINGRATNIPTPCGIKINPALKTEKPFMFWKNKGNNNIGPLVAIPVRNKPTITALKFFNLNKCSGRMARSF
jgi:hypothetical protein